MFSAAFIQLSTMHHEMFSRDIVKLKIRQKRIMYHGF